MESIPCNLCGHESAHAIYQVVDTNYGQPGIFSLVECDKCGLIFMNPRPTAQEIGNYYPATQYHPFRALTQIQNVKPNATHQKRAAQIAKFQKNGASRKVLDVGCGSGLFLLAMRERGWQVYGVEPNSQAAGFAQTSLNLPVAIGDIFTVEPGATFDLITFWDVLEHTHSPREVLLQAQRLLNPNGWLAINVPNWASWERKIFKEKWIAIDAPRHLYHFSSNTLTKMLQSCGFDIIKIGSKTPVMNPASNLLRILGNVLRSIKQTKKNDGDVAAPTTIQQPTAGIKKWLIRATYAAMTLPNLLANAVRRGGSITVYARKKGT